MGSLPLDNIRLDSSLANQIYTAPVTNSGAELTTQLSNIAGQLNTHTANLNANLNNLQNVSAAQNTMYTIADIESRRLSDKKNNIDQALQGQNRMIALNDSYVKKYAKYNQIIMVVVLIILAILGAILLQTYLPMVPSFIGDLIMILAVGVGGIVIYLLYMSIQARDSLYFDKLNIPSPTVKDLSDNAAALKDIPANLFGLGYCVGQACCTEPSKYINSLGKCVNPPTAIYDYTNGKYKTCGGQQGCKATDKTSEITWTWDDPNNQWINPGLSQGSYWDFSSGLTGQAATLASVKQSFTTMEQMGAQPMQSSETSEYSFYR
jgi:hypothetical protein